MDQEFHFSPIGYVRGQERYRGEAPRQAVFARNRGCIELLPGHNYETALQDLDSFDRIWVVFVFHLNHGWKPKVRPPVSPDGARYGLFSTRSPHRPNPIGISCVELEGVEGLKLHIRNFDILDATPVLDIKPYISRSDAFPEASSGWLPAELPEEWELDFSENAMEQINFVFARSGLDLAAFCRVQLVHNPMDATRKRIADEDGGVFSIACRTWRVCFIPDHASHRLTLTEVKSNYSPDDLLPGAPDPYGDKQYHREFLLWLH